MNPGERLRQIGSYLIAADVFNRYFEAENRILETGQDGTSRIFLLRLRGWPTHSATLIARWTGIDLAIRGSRRLLGK